MQVRDPEVVWRDPGLADPEVVWRDPEVVWRDSEVVCGRLVGQVFRHPTEFSSSNLSRVLELGAECRTGACWSRPALADVVL